MKPLVLMRGGGDIASGAVYRLRRAGYPVVISEIAIPTMIRREVCYGNAVHLGTKRDDADLVIGVGPGFTAGEDVDVVIETMRGHSLGRCIYDGPAQPNTGIPGNVGGYTHERVIHSPKAGLFTAKRHIGDSVQANEVIGYVDEEPVRAKITGILRGILKSGLIVSDHFKLADVDARCEESHCYSISDKSLAVGGGVLEAVTAWDYERNLDGNNL